MTSGGRGGKNERLPILWDSCGKETKASLVQSKQDYTRALRVPGIRFFSVHVFKCHERL